MSLIEQTIKIGNSQHRDRPSSLQMQRTSRTNGFSVSQSVVLCLKNAFDITISQTINPVPSQRRCYRLQQLELRFILQMEW